MADQRNVAERGWLKGLNPTMGYAAKAMVLSAPRSLRST